MPIDCIKDNDCPAGQSCVNLKCAVTSKNAKMWLWIVLAIIALLIIIIVIILLTRKR